MALAGAAKLAMEGFIDAPVKGKMLADVARLPLRAGAVANGITVAVAQAISLSSTFEQDVRDFCDDCGVTQRSIQNMVRDHFKAMLEGGGINSGNLSQQLNLVVRAGVSGGETAAETEERVKKVLKAAQEKEAAGLDLSQRKYSVALHTLTWQGGGDVVAAETEQNVLHTKMYQRHKQAHGRTLQGAVAGGQTTFRSYMADVRADAETRGETHFRDAVATMVDTLDTKCYGNWTFFEAYMQKWIQRHATNGVATPFDDQLLREVEAKSRAAAFTPALEPAQPSTTVDAAGVLKFGESLVEKFGEMQQKAAQQQQQAGMAGPPPAGFYGGSSGGYSSPQHNPWGVPPPGWSQPQPPQPPPPYMPPAPGWNPQWGGSGAPPNGYPPGGYPQWGGGGGPPPFGSGRGQVPGNPAYTGCIHCGSKDHLAAQCPNKGGPRVKLEVSRGPAAPAREEERGRRTGEREGGREASVEDGSNRLGVGKGQEEGQERGAEEEEKEREGPQSGGGEARRESLSPSAPPIDRTKAEATEAAPTSEAPHDVDVFFTRCREVIGERATSGKGRLPPGLGWVRVVRGDEEASYEKTARSGEQGADMDGRSTASTRSQSLASVDGGAARLTGMGEGERGDGELKTSPAVHAEGEEEQEGRKGEEGEGGETEDEPAVGGQSEPELLMAGADAGEDRAQPEPAAPTRSCGIGGVDVEGESRKAGGDEEDSEAVSPERDPPQEAWDGSASVDPRRNAEEDHARSRLGEGEGRESVSSESNKRDVDARYGEEWAGRQPAALRILAPPGMGIGSRAPEMAEGTLLAGSEGLPTICESTSPLSSGEGEVSVAQSTLGESGAAEKDESAVHPAEEDGADREEGGEGECERRARERAEAREVWARSLAHISASPPSAAAWSSRGGGDDPRPGGKQPRRGGSEKRRESCRRAAAKVQAASEETSEEEEETGLLDAIIDHRGSLEEVRGRAGCGALGPQEEDEVEWWMGFGWEAAGRKNRKGGKQSKEGSRRLKGEPRGKGRAHRGKLHAAKGERRGDRWEGPELTREWMSLHPSGVGQAKEPVQSDQGVDGGAEQDITLAQDDEPRRPPSPADLELAAAEGRAARDSSGLSSGVPPAPSPIASSPAPLEARVRCDGDVETISVDSGAEGCEARRGGAAVLLGDSVAAGVPPAPTPSEPSPAPLEARVRFDGGMETISVDCSAEGCEARRGSAAEPLGGSVAAGREATLNRRLLSTAEGDESGRGGKEGSAVDERRIRLRWDFEREFKPLSEQRQRRLGVRALALLAHRTWSVPGGVAERAARATFEPNHEGFYRLARWRAGDGSSDEWGILARNVASAAQGEEQEAPLERPETREPGAPSWWLRATRRARVWLRAWMPSHGSDGDEEVEAHDPDRADREREGDRTVWGEMAQQAGDAFVLQWTYLRNRARWSRGSFPRRFSWARPAARPRCGNGARLAGPQEFEAQASRASDVLAFYEMYVAIRRRLSGGAGALDLCCGGGGQSQGIKRMGARPYGVDKQERASYKRSFGDDSFEQADVLAQGMIDGALRQVTQAVGIMAGPSCKGTSTATFAGTPSREPVIIAELRDKLDATGRLYSVEQPLGTSRLMRRPVTLRGSMFGLHVDRPRLFECNFPVHLDEALKQGERELRPRTCLGRGARYKALDPFGRSCDRECCEGNILAVQGSGASRQRAVAWADAMDLDLGEMTSDEVSQAVPPAYAQLIFGQMAMRDVGRRYGCPEYTYDDVVGRPELRHELLAWVKGAGAAGDPSPRFEPPPREPDGADGGSAGAAATPVEAPVGPAKEADWKEAEWSLRESDFRELEYSATGDFDASVIDEGAPDWLASLRAASCWRRQVNESQLRGKNTFVQCNVGRLRRLIPVLVAALAHRGTRLTVVAPDRAGAKWLGKLESAGLVPTRPSFDTHSVRGWRGETRLHGEKLVILTGGSRASRVVGRSFDYEAIEPFMDPYDTGRSKTDKAAKEALAFSPMPAPDAAAWEAAGASESIVSIFREGARLHVDEEGVTGEIGQYPWPDPIAQLQCIAECDRALWVGAMEPVPPHLVEETEKSGRIHPWTIVHQGAEKWRACHDLSRITNGLVTTTPFRLPTPWDVVRALKPGSYMAKYDLRDGFWSVPVHPADRHNMCIRHPATGRLLWSARLPFGFSRSPEIFCAVTEEVAEIARRRGAGMGFSVFVFVDDFCIVGDDESCAEAGCKILEELLEELGLQWAPHKRRGPARAIEFLGRFISNVPGHRGIGLSKERKAAMGELLRQWTDQRPAGGEELQVEPRELARLLGNLVFVSEVVKGGRTYLQGSLAQFKGLEVDWERGTVRPVMGARGWDKMTVTAGFWNDLEWWSQQLEHNHRYAFEESAAKRASAAVLAGTDASGWGTGQLIYIGGEVEEETLRFTKAEQRRPINWRELLGILRVVERWGEALRGRTILVETDNIVAHFVSRKMSAHTADMQELLRRLLERCAEYEITLKTAHTPGALLKRPDELSRGEEAAAPRQRLRQRWFSSIEGAWGRFDEFLGREGEHRRPDEGAAEEDGGSRRRPGWLVPPRSTSRTGAAISGEGGEAAAAPEENRGVGASVLWAHPSYTTVGSALRSITERLRVAAGQEAPVRGIILVPYSPTARWWGLTRHFTVVGELGAGAESLEEARGAGWAPIRSLRRTVILAFPRLAGRVCIPLDLAVAPRQMWEKQRTHAPPPEECGYLTLMPGSVLLEMTSGGVGGLDEPRVWRTHDRYSPWELGSTRGPVCVLMEAEYGTRRGSKQSYVVRADAAATEVKRTQYLFVIDAMVERDMESGGEGACTRVSLSMADCVAAARACWERQARVMLGQESTAGPSREAAELAAENTARGDISEADQRAIVALGGSSRGGEDPSGQWESPALDAALRAGRAEAVIEDRQSPARPSSSDPPVSAMRRTRGTQAMEEAGFGGAVCQSSGMECYGCRKPLAVGAPAAAAGGHLAHRAPACVKKAKERFAQEAGEFPTIDFTSGEAGADGEVLGPNPHVPLALCGPADEDDSMAPVGEVVTEGGAAEGELLTRKGSGAVAAERRSSKRKLTSGPARSFAALRCIDGGCGCQAPHDMFCVVCDKGIHGRQCLDVNSGKVAVGLFKCADCSLRATGASGYEPDSEIRKLAAESMVSSITDGSENFGSAMARASKLQTEFATWMAKETSGEIVLPSNCTESAILFARWLASRRDLAPSLRATMRALGALSGKARTRAGKEKVFDKDVHCEIDNLMKAFGDDPVPKTRCTSTMFGIFMNELIPGKLINLPTTTRAQQYIVSRDKVLGAAEGVGGLRVGDATGADETHGLVAENVYLLKDKETGERTVELMLDSGKMGFKRSVNMVGETLTSRVPVADIFAEHCKIAGYELATWDEGRFSVSRPASTVARLNLVAIDEAHVASFKAMLEDTRLPPFVKKCKGDTLHYLAKRLDATSNENKKYVNFAEASEAQALEGVLNLAKEWGLEDYVTTTPGPFLRATRGASITMMPLSEGSTYDKFVKLLPDAEKIAQSRGDPDFDLETRSESSYGNHSLRQMADHVARKTMHLTGATEIDIDRMFGWNEAWYRKKMQLHYAGRDERVKRAKITSYV